MIYKTLAQNELSPHLSATGSFGGLHIYCRDSGKPRPALLILPGGGIRMRSAGEAEPVALEFLSRGYQCFVLEYSLVPAKWPQQLLETAAALNYIRANSDVYRVLPDKIAVMGFSAGGFLTAALSNLWYENWLAEALRTEAGLLRPNAAVLCYPVITTVKPKRFNGGTTLTHDSLGVTDRLGGELSKLQLDTGVSAKNPPAFIWHSFDDEMVPVENSLSYASALREVGVPFELHIYPHGLHAMGLCSRESAWRREGVDSHNATWVQLCDEWMERVFG